LQDIPPGITAVLTKSSTDVLSHVEGTDSDSLLVVMLLLLLAGHPSWHHRSADQEQH
jgi:hypothetical protein